MSQVVNLLFTLLKLWPTRLAQKILNLILCQMSESAMLNQRNQCNHIELLNMVIPTKDQCN